MIMGLIEERIKESIAVKEAILCDGVLMGRIQDAADIIAESLGRGGKILFCGNGGSASDALHLPKGKGVPSRNRLECRCGGNDGDCQ